jgi:hypothetical protein
MVQNGEIEEMRPGLKGGVNDTKSSGSVASSAMLPQMDSVTREVDALACKEEDASMPLIERTMTDKVTDIPEDEEGMQRDRGMSIGVNVVEV